MESEKLEDLLLLSLSATKGQRERSEVLDVGVTRDKTCGRSSSNTVGTSTDCRYPEWRYKSFWLAMQL